MEITINGKRENGNFSTVLALVESLGIKPETVVVEINGQILKGADFGGQLIKAGDRLEIVHFVGGG